MSTEQLDDNQQERNRNGKYSEMAKKERGKLKWKSRNSFGQLRRSEFEKYYKIYIWFIHLIQIEATFERKELIKHWTRRKGKQRMTRQIGTVIKQFNYVTNLYSAWWLFSIYHRSTCECTKCTVSIVWMVELLLTLIFYLGMDLSFFFSPFRSDWEAKRIEKERQTNSNIWRIHRFTRTHIQNIQFNISKLICLPCLYRITNKSLEQIEITANRKFDVFVTSARYSISIFYLAPRMDKKCCNDKQAITLPWIMVIRFVIDVCTRFVW